MSSGARSAMPDEESTGGPSRGAVISAAITAWLEVLAALALLLVPMPVPLAVAVLALAAPVFAVLVATGCDGLCPVRLIVGGALSFAGVYGIAVAVRRRRWLGAILIPSVAVAWLLLWLCLLGIMEPIEWDSWTESVLSQGAGVEP